MNYSPSCKIKAKKGLNIRGLFRSCLQTERTALGIVELIIMSLSNVYYDPNHPAGFSSVAKLVKISKNKKRDMEEWMSSQNTYTLHKPVRKRFPRNPYTVTTIDDVWELDLAESSLAKYNGKYKNLLNVIDIF